jgi:lycopene cyclase domain-containing protein
MGSRYQYLALLAVCLVGTAFLEFRFDARIWRRPLTVARALLVPWTVFNLVNELAVFRHLWFYNPAFVTGWQVPRHYPVEEVCFFVAIPLCALLTFEAASGVYAGRVVAPWSRGAAGRDRPPPAVHGGEDVPRWRPAASAVAGGLVAFAVLLLAIGVVAEARTDPGVRAAAHHDYLRFSIITDWNVPEYPFLVVALVAGVLLLEWAWWRTGIFRMRAYWSTMAICLLFMVPVNGWLTKLSAPVVIYAADEFSGLRPVWDIPLEDFGFGIALLTLVLMSWVRVIARARINAGRTAAAA